MKVDYEGEVLEFDLEKITVRQAMMLKQKLGLTLLGLDEGLATGDPAAMLAVYWLMRTLNGDKVDIDDLDFKVVVLANAIQEAVEKEEAAAKATEEENKKGPKEK
jgi:hypothetical protein